MTATDDFNDAASKAAQLLTAAKKNETGTIHRLLYEKVDVNTADENGVTALMHAVIKENTDTIALLIGQGADVDKPAPDGSTARSLATGRRNGEMTLFIERLLSDRACYALFDAIRKKDHDKVQEILESKAISDINRGPRRDPWGSIVGDSWIPISLAIAEDNLCALDLLLQAGASANAISEGAKVPLLEAVSTWNASPFIIQKLLDYKADPDAGDAYGKFPLVVAANKGQETTVMLLLEHGANVNINAGQGDTAAHEAAEKGHAEILRILKTYNADFTVLNHQEQPLLESAILNRHREAAETLIELGADPLQKGKNGITLVIDAAWVGDAGMIESLMKSGIDINAQAEGGFTALMYAAMEGRGEAVRKLLDLGANYDLKTEEGKTVLELAKEKGHFHAEKLIAAKIAEDVRLGLRVADPVKKPFRLALEMRNG
ncbi:MAG: ankyrin repeat domain-containing protein [Alphaproteobacteria bacterium]